MQRLVAGMGANAFGQGVSILIQLASLPLFLSRWDLSTYGVWLLLSAFASYLTMADVGMVTAAGNRMTMALAAGRLDEAQRVFQSAGAFMALVCAAVAAVALPVLVWAPIPGLDSADRQVAMAALVLAVIASLWGGLVEAVFRATGRYAVGTFLGNMVRLGEWLGSLIGLVAFGSFAAVALGALAARLAGLALSVAWSRRDAQGLRWGWASARKDEVRAMVAPAGWFMVFPLAQALSFQGTTILVGQFLGPAAVAVFNTYRTLTRVPVQLTAIFGHALAPELSRLHGAGTGETLRRFYRKALLTGFALTAAASLLLTVAGPWLLEHWTRGAVAFEPALFAAMLLAAAVACAWHVPRMLLLSTNQHAPLARAYLASAALGLVIAAWAVGVAGLVGVALSLLIAELSIAIFGGTQARAATSPTILPALHPHP